MSLGPFTKNRNMKTTSIRNLPFLHFWLLLCTSHIRVPLFGFEPGNVITPTENDGSFKSYPCHCEGVLFSCSFDSQLALESYDLLACENKTEDNLELGSTKPTSRQGRGEREGVFDNFRNLDLMALSQGALSANQLGKPTFPDRYVCWLNCLLCCLFVCFFYFRRKQSQSLAT